MSEVMRSAFLLVFGIPLMMLTGRIFNQLTQRPWNRKR